MGETILGRFIKWVRNNIEELESSNMLAQQLPLPKIDLYTYPELIKQMELIGFTAQDMKFVKSFQPYIKNGIDEITSVFYEKVLEVPSLRRIIDERTNERM